MTDTIANILDRAADLIEPEGTWIQGEYARNQQGRSVKPYSKAAICWCRLGALYRVCKATAISTPPTGVFGAIRAVQGSGDVGDFVNWNDAEGRTQAEAVNSFREAAARARASLEGES